MTESARAQLWRKPPHTLVGQPTQQSTIINHNEQRLTSPNNFRTWDTTRGPNGHIMAYLAPEYNVPPLYRAILILWSTWKNTNLVEDVEIFFPIKFRWIPFNGFWVEVENVSANQRPGQPSCFSNLPEKRKLGRRHWDHASCQVLLNSIQQF